MCAHVLMCLRACVGLFVCGFMRVRICAFMCEKVHVGMIGAEAQIRMNTQMRDLLSFFFFFFFCTSACAWMLTVHVLDAHMNTECKMRILTSVCVKMCKYECNLEAIPAYL